MAGLRWTREAGLWMRDIFEHIAHDNPEAAARPVEGVYARAQVLTKFPGSVGHRYEPIPDREVRRQGRGDRRFGCRERQGTSAIAKAG